MRKKIFEKCSYLLLSFLFILFLYGIPINGQEVQAESSQQEEDSGGIMPMSAMRVDMNTSIDNQDDVQGYKEVEVNVNWIESLAIKEPVTIAVTKEAKILVEDMDDIIFKVNGVPTEISDLRIEEDKVQFMTGKAVRRANCSLTYKIRTPIAAGEFNISTKVAAEQAPSTMSNYVERTIKVTTGLTVETTYDTIYGDLPFDVFGLVNYKIHEQNKDLLISLDVYNKETGEMVYEITGADFPTDNTYTMGSFSFPDYCEDGTYIVYVTLVDGREVIGSASKEIKYVKSKEFKITVKDIVSEQNSEDIQFSREFIYELGQTIDTIQPKTIEDASIENVVISPSSITSLHVVENYNVIGIMPIGNVEITYYHTMNNGFIDGFVTNTSGVPISNASITAYKSNGIDGEMGTFISTVYTDTKGKFNYAIREGLYNFVIAKDGYITLEVFNIEIKQNETYYLEKSLIIADVPGNGNISGVVKNAYSGGALPGVTLTFRHGWNNTTGVPVVTGSGIIQTNSSGVYNVVLPYGNYTAELSKDGYVTSYINVICALDYNIQQNAAITPVLSSDEYRVVLTWEATPRDLDSHLTGPSNDNQRFHVFYSNKEFVQSNGSAVKLDTDDTNGYGPETITFKINPNINGVYRYSVYDFTNGGNASSQAMSLSGAQIKVYNGSELKADFNIPTNKTGTVWTVFEVDNGVFKPINTFSNNQNVMSILKK